MRLGPDHRPRPMFTDSIYLSALKGASWIGVGESIISRLADKHTVTLWSLLWTRPVIRALPTSFRAVNRAQGSARVQRLLSISGFLSGFSGLGLKESVEPPDFGFRRFWQCGKCTIEVFLSSRPAKALTSACRVSSLRYLGALF